MNLFTRREIRVTRHAEEQLRICGVLERNGIQTQVVTHSTTNARRHHGVPGIQSDYAYEYRIYVDRKDFKKAKSLLTRP